MACDDEIFPVVLTVDCDNTEYCDNAGMWKYFRGRDREIGIERQRDRDT